MTDHEETAKRICETDAALNAIHRGWCNYCAGRDDICEKTAGTQYQCVLIYLRVAVAAALAERGVEVKRLGELLVDRDKYIHELRVDFKAKRDAAEAKGFVKGLERAKECCIPWLQCNCDSAYTDRGRHEPNVWHELAEEIDMSIQAEIDKAGKP